MSVDQPGQRSWGSLSRDQVVQAALRIARDEGLGALTIRRLATELSASRMSLYYYVPNKQALLELVADAAASTSTPDQTDHFGAGLQLPERTGNWEDDLRAVARAQRAAMRASPGLAELLVKRGNYQASGLRVIERVVSLLLEAGLDDYTAGRFYVVFADSIWSRVLHELHGGDVTDVTRVKRAEATLASVSREEFPNVRRTLDALRITADELFETELDLLLSGIRAAAQ